MQRSLRIQESSFGLHLVTLTDGTCVFDGYSGKCQHFTLDAENNTGTPSTCANVLKLEV